MKIHLQDIVKRLAQFSEKLDNSSLFIDKPWVLIDTNSDYQKYIFKRNGELIMSINGHVQVGKWEYLSSAKSILIDRIKDKVLLNHSFVDRAVMVLRFDGSINHLFVLANEMVIPDLDVKKYLQTLTHRKFNVITGRLENGSILEVYKGSETFVKIGMKATIDGEEPIDGKYKLKKSRRNYELKNGKIINITNPVNYKTINGQIVIIEQVNDKSISIGDLVYIDDMLAKKGKYKLGFFKYITVKNGFVCKKSNF